MFLFDLGICCDTSMTQEQLAYSPCSSVTSTNSAPPRMLISARSYNHHTMTTCEQHAIEQQCHALLCYNGSRHDQERTEWRGAVYRHILLNGVVPLWQPMRAAIALVRCCTRHAADDVYHVSNVPKTKASEFMSKVVALEAAPECPNTSLVKPSGPECF